MIPEVAGSNPVTHPRLDDPVFIGFGEFCGKLERLSICPTLCSRGTQPATFFLRLSDYGWAHRDSQVRCHEFAPQTREYSEKRPSGIIRAGVFHLTLAIPVPVPTVGKRSRHTVRDGITLKSPLVRSAPVAIFAGANVTANCETYR